MRRLLDRVLEALEKQRVLPIVLKGYGLAARLYGDPLSRPCSDVDILVATGDLPRVAEALRNLGLAKAEDEYAAPEEAHHHVAFAAPGRLVEVHYRLFYGLGGSIDDARVWANASPFKLLNHDVKLLGPEDEFVYLATHAANHLFLRALWLYDLKLFALHHPGLRWQMVEEYSRGDGFLPAVVAALGFLRRHLDCVPAGLTRGLAARSLVQSTMARTVFSARSVASGAFSSDRVGALLRVVLADGSLRRFRALSDGLERVQRRRRQSI